MDVIVIGGGIVGLSSAYALAQRGASVRLFEKGSLGMGSTARSAGGIRSQFETPVNVALSLASKRVWNEFEERFGVDIGYRKTGYLFLARSEAVAGTFRENVRMQQRLGADSEFLDPAEAGEICEGLITEQFVAATYNGDDGFADPNLAVQGYAGAAREAGVDIRTGTAVTGLLTDGDAVVGVETAEERHDAEFVVNAGGPCAREIGAMAGVDLPIHPRRRQIAVVDATRPVPEDDPLTIDLETGSYFRPEREGAALVGGHFDDEDPDQDPDEYDDSMELDWAADAVEGADVVVTATTSSEPVFPADALQDGALVVAIGAYTAEMQEVEAAVYERAGRVFADVPAEVAETGDLLAADLDEPDLVPLGDLLAAGDGDRSGERSVSGEAFDDDLVVVKSVGSATLDATAGAAIYEAAEGAGTDVSME